MHPITALKLCVGTQPTKPRAAGPHPTVTFDAVTRYVVQKNPSLLAGMPFATGIAEPEAATWESAKEAGHKLIPSISPGWDPSPREQVIRTTNVQIKAVCC